MLPARRKSQGHALLQRAWNSDTRPKRGVAFVDINASVSLWMAPSCEGRLSDLGSGKTKDRRRPVFANQKRRVRKHSAIAVSPKTSGANCNVIDHIVAVQGGFFASSHPLLRAHRDYGKTVADIHGTGKFKIRPCEFICTNLRRFRSSSAKTYADAALQQRL